MLNRYSLEITQGAILMGTTILSHFDPVLSTISLIGGIIGAVLFPSLMYIGASAAGGVSGALLLNRLKDNIKDNLQKKISWALVGTAFSIFGSATVHRSISWFKDWDDMFMYFMCGVFGAFVLSIIAGFFRSAESKSEDIADRYFDKRFDLDEEEEKEKPSI